jgi:hypothetical protein
VWQSRQPLIISNVAEEKETLLPQMSGSLVLSLGGEPAFWPRPEAIRRTLDLIQK